MTFDKKNINTASALLLRDASHARERLVNQTHQMMCGNWRLPCGVRQAIGLKELKKP